MSSGGSLSSSPSRSGRTTFPVGEATRASSLASAVPSSSGQAFVATASPSLPPEESDCDGQSLRLAAASGGGFVFAAASGGGSVIRLAVRCRPGQAEIVLADLMVLAPNGVEEEGGEGYVEYAIYGEIGRAHV